MHGVIVTGASRGLGLALTHALLADGARVVALARSTSFELTRLADAYPQHLATLLVDLADSDKLPQAGKEMVAALGAGPFSSLTLINNAGVVTPVAPAGAYPPAEAIRAVHVNLLAPMLLTDALLKHAEALAPQLRILNISSGAAVTAYPGWSVYGGTKAGLDHFSRTVAAEQTGNAVKVVSLYPGVIDTGMQETIRHSDPELFPNKERFDKLKSEGQLATPEATARRVLDYLNSAAFGSEAVVDVRSL
jgi:NAD(P)-dependent dehydrogenase (short-subunit alcohol dehydrogenase family)